MVASGGGHGEPTACIARTRTRPSKGIFHFNMRGDQSLVPLLLYACDCAGWFSDLS